MTRSITHRSMAGCENSLASADRIDTLTPAEADDDYRAKVVPRQQEETKTQVEMMTEVGIPDRYAALMT